MKMNIGQDFQARALGGNTAPGVTGTATSSTATSLTTQSTAPSLNCWAGLIVFAGSSYGVILSNTNGANSVLTIDKWYSPASPGGAAASTPSGTSVYVIGLGMQPAGWLALTTDSAAVNAADVALASELSGNGLQRALGSFGHTAGVASYTLTNLFTSTDSTPRTIAKMAVFNAATNTTGQYMLFESLVTPNAIINNGDQLTLTETVSM